MRIRRNSIVTFAVILALFVLAKVIVAVQAPAGQQGAGAAAGGGQGGAAAPGQRGGRGGRGRGGQPAPPAGPTPRLSNGKPDLSGHWANPYTSDMTGRGGQNILDPTKPTADGTSFEPLNWDRKGEALKGTRGELVKTFDLPYTEWGLKKWADYAPELDGDYAGSCLPFGISRSINSPHGLQMVHHVDALAILFEQNTWFHFVPTNPAFKWPADLPPSWTGTSVGRWEGDTLVIETTGFNGWTRLDTRGHPHSKEMKITNKLTRLDSNTIRHVVIVHDPKAYTQDWANVRTWNLKPNNDVLMEYSCEENNLQALQDGSIKIWQAPETED